MPIDLPTWFHWFRHLVICLAKNRNPQVASYSTDVVHPSFVSIVPMPWPHWPVCCRTPDPNGKIRHDEMGNNAKKTSISHKHHIKVQKEYSIHWTFVISPNVFCTNICQHIIFTICVYTFSSIRCFFCQLFGRWSGPAGHLWFCQWSGWNPVRLGPMISIDLHQADMQHCNYSNLGYRVKFKINPQKKTCWVHFFITFIMSHHVQCFLSAPSSWDSYRNITGSAPNLWKLSRPAGSRWHSACLSSILFKALCGKGLEKNMSGWYDVWCRIHPYRTKRNR